MVRYQLKRKNSNGETQTLSFWSTVTSKNLMPTLLEGLPLIKSETQEFLSVPIHKQNKMFKLYAMLMCLVFYASKQKLILNTEVSTFLVYKVTTIKEALNLFIIRFMILTKKT